MAENASTVGDEYCEQHTTENDKNIDLDPEEDIQNYFQNIEDRFERSSDEGSEQEAKGQPNCYPHSEQTTDTAEPNTASPELNVNISQTSQNISQDNQEAPKVDVENIQTHRKNLSLLNTQLIRFFFNAKG